MVAQGSRPFGQAKDAALAVAAYKRYLKLQPNGIQAQSAKQTIKQLQPYLPKQKQ